MSMKAEAAGSSTLATLPRSFQDFRRTMNAPPAGSGSGATLENNRASSHCIVPKKRNATCDDYARVL